MSHNALSDTQSNGKTISAFFHHWDRDSLAQVYLTTDVPDYTVCGKFFQINDFDLLKRFFGRKSFQGRMVDESLVPSLIAIKKEVKNHGALVKIRRNVSPFFRFLRDVIWTVGGFKTHALKTFIDDFRPDIVFFQSSGGVFAFSLTRWICKSYNIPLIMQTTDDYVTGFATLDLFFWIQHVRLNSAYRWAVNYSTCIVAIGEKMANEYKDRFGGNYLVAMNSVPEIDLPKYTGGNDTVYFVYAGNLGLNRWKILVLIASCLEELRREEGLKGHLSIYSLIEPNPDELILMNQSGCSSYEGSLNTQELNEVKSRSDVLVHVEAFDKKNMHITRLSISTKIPEYLASGRCIFAVGPNDVASMQYLEDYDLGVTVMTADRAVIKERLREVITDKARRIHYAGKGVVVARARHDRKKTAELISQRIESICLDNISNAQR